MRNFTCGRLLTYLPVGLLVCTSMLALGPSKWILLKVSDLWQKYLIRVTKNERQCSCQGGQEDYQQIDCFPNGLQPWDTLVCFLSLSLCISIPSSSPDLSLSLSLSLSALASLNSVISLSIHKCVYIYIFHKLQYNTSPRADLCDGVLWGCIATASTNYNHKGENFMGLILFISRPSTSGHTWVQGETLLFNLGIAYPRGLCTSTSRCGHHMATEVLFVSFDPSLHPSLPRLYIYIHTGCVVLGLGKKLLILFFSKMVCPKLGTV